MKKVLFIAFVFLAATFFSQNNQAILKQISKADSVFVVVETSGCFDAGVKTYVFKKLGKSKRSLVVMGSNQKPVSVSAKKYNLFLNKYLASKNHFNSDQNPTCTLTTDFDLHDKKQHLAFKNGTCENEFNPDNYLQELLKQ